MVAKKQEPTKLPEVKEEKPLDETKEELTDAKAPVDEKKAPADATKAPFDEKKAPPPVVPFDDEPEIKADATPSPWEKVEMLSDDEMTVEAVNIHAYQRSAMLLRFKVHGQLTGQVQVLDRMQYKSHDGTIKAR